MCRREALSNKWQGNSCWVDAALTLWETMQRWLLISRDQSSELRVPPLQLPADCTLKLGAGAKLSVVSNLGQALREWWQLRVAEIVATEGELDVAALTQRLMAARDAVRLAFLQRTLKSLSLKRTEAALQRELQAEMGRMGGTVRALEVFTQPAHASFLSAGSTSKCAALPCGKLLRSPPDLASYATSIVLSAAELTDAEGDCFASLQVKANQPRKQKRQRACPTVSKAAASSSSRTRAWWRTVPPHSSCLTCLLTRRLACRTTCGQVRHRDRSSSVAPCRAAIASSAS